jgi:hypothetical protein
MVEPMIQPLGMEGASPRPSKDRTHDAAHLVRDEALPCQLSSRTAPIPPLDRHPGVVGPCHSTAARGTGLWVQVQVQRRASPPKAAPHRDVPSSAPGCAPPPPPLCAAPIRARWSLFWVNAAAARLRLAALASSRLSGGDTNAGRPLAMAAAMVNMGSTHLQAARVPQHAAATHKGAQQCCCASHPHTPQAAGQDLDPSGRPVLPCPGLPGLPSFHGPARAAKLSRPPDTAPQPGPATQPPPQLTAACRHR